MAVTAYVYGTFLKKLADQILDIESDGLKILAARSGYTPNQATHAVIGDVTNEHPAEDNYVAGGFDIADAAVGSYADGAVLVTGDDVVQPTVQLTDVRYFVVYVDNASTKHLVGYIDLGQDMTSAPETGFEIQWDGSVDGSGGTVLAHNISVAGA